MNNSALTKMIKPAISLHLQKTARSTIVEITRDFYGNESVISHGDYSAGLNQFPPKSDPFFHRDHMQNKFGDIPYLHPSDQELLNLAVRDLQAFSYVGFAETFEDDLDNILTDLELLTPVIKSTFNFLEGSK